jgi:hypothetical protein
MGRRIIDFHIEEKNTVHMKNSAIQIIWKEIY